MKKPNIALRRFAIKLLRENGCDRGCYKGCSLREVVESLEDYAKDNNHNKFWTDKWPIKTIAKMLITLGNETPEPKKDKYHLIWENDNCCDGFDVGNNIRYLKDHLKEFYIGQITSFSGTPEDWDYMVANTSAIVYRNEDLTDDVDTEEIWNYRLSDEDRKDIWFVETSEMPDDVYERMAHQFGWSERISK